MKNLLMKTLLALLLLTNAASAAEPLPSWNDIAPKKAITAFVEKVTKEGSADFVWHAERSASKDATMKTTRARDEGDRRKALRPKEVQITWIA